MKRWYEGDKPCPGCGRSGKEITRESKDGLCPQCRRLLDKARIGEMESREYSRVFVTWYSFFYAPLDTAVHEFLKKISMDEAKCLPIVGQYNLGKRCAVTASNCYYIPRFVAVALDELIQALMKEGEMLRTAYDELPKKAAEEVAKEKQRYFAEGVAHGRQLLIQLNRGEISLQDFNAIPKRY